MKKPISPIGPAQFKRVLAIHLTIQFATIFLGWFAYKSAMFDGLKPLELGILVFLLLIQLFFALRYNFGRFVTGRLLDIHADLPEKQRWLYHLYGMCPLLNIPFTTYLATAPTGSRRFPFLIKWRIVICGLIGLFAFGPLALCGRAMLLRQSASGIRAISYWTANPTTTFVVSIADEASMLLSTIDEIKSSEHRDSSEWRLAQYAHVQSPSLTAMVLMMVGEVSVLQNCEPNCRKLADLDKSRKLIQLLESLRGIIAQFETSGSTTLNINPVSLLSPPAVFEALLLSIMDLATRHRAFRALARHSSALISEAEKSTSDPELLARAQALRQSLSQLRIFQGLSTQ